MKPPKIEYIIYEHSLMVGRVVITYKLSNRISLSQNGFMVASVDRNTTFDPTYEK